MKEILVILIVTLTLFSAHLYAQSKTDKVTDEKEIRQVVANVEAAWAAGDAVKFADNFTDDVDYTVWNGFQVNGREENIKGHQQIFDTVYKGTMIKMEFRKIRFLTETIATVHLEAKMYRDGERVAEVPTVVPLMVLNKQNNKWRIAVFQNTPIIKQGELVIGRNETKAEDKK